MNNVPLPEPDQIFEQQHYYGGIKMHAHAAAVSAAENAKLKTVMIAAAEEIKAHWDAHCDADGYGPLNLMRRLEEGIPSQYGYTAGRFAELERERNALRAELAKHQESEFHPDWSLLVATREGLAEHQQMIVTLREALKLVRANLLHRFPTSGSLLVAEIDAALGSQP